MKLGVAHVHGLEPQLLIPKVIRERIYESEYWKCNCVAVPFVTTLQKALKLQYVGGTFGGNYKPTPFVSLLLKLLQLGPSVSELECMLNTKHKYVQALLCFYWRLTLPTVQVYQKLEPFYADFRKLRMRKRDGTFCILYFDEFVEKLLTEDTIFQVSLSYLLKRHVLEETGQLLPRTSPLEAELVQEKSVIESKEEPVVTGTTQPVIEKKKKSSGKLKFKKVTKEEEAISVEDANALRAKLGLKPLS